MRTPTPIRTRRLGQPGNHHSVSLCQGCVNGLCKPADYYQHQRHNNAASNGYKDYNNAGNKGYNNASNNGYNNAANTVSNNGYNKAGYSSNGINYNSKKNNNLEESGRGEEQALLSFVSGGGERSGRYSNNNSLRRQQQQQGKSVYYNNNGYQHHNQQQYQQSHHYTAQQQQSITSGGEAVKVTGVCDNNNNRQTVTTTAINDGNQLPSLAGNNNHYNPSRNNCIQDTPPTKMVTVDTDNQSWNVGSAAFSSNAHRLNGIQGVNRGRGNMINSNGGDKDNDGGGGERSNLTHRRRYSVSALEAVVATTSVGYGNKTSHVDVAGDGGRRQRRNSECGNNNKDSVIVAAFNNNNEGYQNYHSSFNGRRNNTCNTVDNKPSHNPTFSYSQQQQQNNIMNDSVSNGTFLNNINDTNSNYYYYYYSDGSSLELYPYYNAALQQQNTAAVNADLYYVPLNNTQSIDSGTDQCSPQSLPLLPSNATTATQYLSPGITDVCNYQWSNNNYLLQHSTPVGDDPNYITAATIPQVAYPNYCRLLPPPPSPYWYSPSPYQLYNCITNDTTTTAADFDANGC